MHIVGMTYGFCTLLLIVFDHVWVGAENFLHSSFLQFYVIMSV